MRILILGGGSVGQVYGLTLYKGGAEISYLVKPRHVPSILKNGFTLCKIDPETRYTNPYIANFRTFQLLSTMEEVAQGPGWDYVLSTLTSSAIREGNGEWLKQLVTAIQLSNKESLPLVVSCGVAVTDREQWLKAGYDPLKVVPSFITLGAWKVPIPGELKPAFKYPDPIPTDPQMVAYEAPVVPLPYCGPVELMGPLTDCFERGGFRTQRNNESTFNFHFLRHQWSP